MGLLELLPVDPAASCFSGQSMSGPKGMLEPTSGEDSPSTSGPTDGNRPWEPVNFLSNSPGSRVFPSAVVHGGRLYIFGGHDGVVYRNDLLVFDLDSRTWTLDLEPHGAGPSPRDAHAAIVFGDAMYVFGGYDSKRYLNDFHRYHFESETWSDVEFAGVAPSPRGGHTAIVHDRHVIVFGGCDGWNYFSDLYRFSFDALEWTPVRVTGTAPGARSAPATVLHAGSTGQTAMYVFGGYDGGRSLNDLFRFDLKLAEWTQVRVTGTPPSPRGGHTAVVHGSTMYAFGGKSGRSPFNDLHSFAFDRGCWELVPAGSSAPAPRCAHTCVVHGSSLFVFGGYDGRRYFDDCFELALEEPTSASVMNLAGDLESMVNNQQFSDVCFEVEGRTVYAHRFILFARCDYFRRMFTSGYRESTDASVKINDVSHDVFLCVLSFLYTGKPRDVSPEMAIEVLGAANLYSIDALKRICAEIITRSLCVENVASILHAADTYELPTLRTQCLHYMVCHFGEVVKTEAFRELVSKETRDLVLTFLAEASARLTLTKPVEAE